MEHLLIAIAVWLSANFGFPALQDAPRVERISAIEMAKLFYQEYPAAHHDETLVDRKILSLYGVEERVIYLPPEWTGRTPADLSLLVHEMVHHMQNLSRAPFPCPQAREKLAYEAQEKWLNMFGHTLEQDLGIDRLTIVLTSACMG